MLTGNFVGRYSDEMARDVRFTAVVRISKFTIMSFARTWDQTPKLITLSNAPFIVEGGSVI